MSSYGADQNGNYNFVGRRLIFRVSDEFSKMSTRVRQSLRLQNRQSDFMNTGSSMRSMRSSNLPVVVIKTPLSSKNADFQAIEDPHPPSSSGPPKKLFFFAALILFIIVIIVVTNVGSPGAQAIQQFNSLAPTRSPTIFTTAFLNEFHTDNPLVDVGEFIEIGVPTQFTQAENVFVQLINGNVPTNGIPYGTPSLLNVEKDFVKGAIVCAGTQFEVTLYVKQFPDFSDSIQNGNNDAIAVMTGGDITDFISYPFDTVTVGGANSIVKNLVSNPIGISVFVPVGKSVSRSGVVNFQNFRDFAWFNGTARTPGAVNEGQTFLCA